MKIPLLDFQARAAASALATLSRGAAKYNQDRADPVRTAFTLSSVTGSGKTVIAAAVLEAALRGSKTFQVDPIEGLTVLWVSYDPDLSAQSRAAIERMADGLDASIMSTVDSSSFAQEKLAPGRITFLSLSLLGEGKPLTRGSESRPFSFWDTLAATVADPDTTLLVVADEAHIGMGRRASGEETLLQRVIAGPGDHPYPGAPMTWGISATPKRFTESIEAMVGEHIGEDVAVDPSDVQDSGLLKQSVALHVPAASGSAMAMTMLGQGLDELVELTRTWTRYCAGAGVPAADTVVPLMVLQLPPREAAADAAPEDRLIAEALSEARRRFPAFGPANVAHVIPGRGTIKLKVAGEEFTVRHIEPNLVEGRTDVRLLIAKDAISTGWNCPRAEVLVSYRTLNDPTAITQMLGRMVRTPLARTTGVDRLDRVSCWTPFFDSAAAQSVVEVLTGDKDPETGQAKASTTVLLDPVRYHLGGGAFVTGDPVPETSVADDEPSPATEVEQLGAAAANTPAPQRQEPQAEQDPAEQAPVQPTEAGPADPEDVPASAADPFAGAVIASAAVVSEVEPIDPEAIATLLALPSTAMPPKRPAPVRRALDLAAALAVDELEPGATATLETRAVEALEHSVRRNAEAVESARQQVTSVSQQVLVKSYGAGVDTRTVTAVAGADIVRKHFDAADRRMGGMGKVHYARAFRDAHAKGDPLDEHALRAEVAAMGRVPQVVQDLEDAAEAFSEQMLARHRDSIALLSPARRDVYKLLRAAGRTPSARAIVLSADRTYSSAASGVRVPKHIYSDAQGLWTLPASTVRNNWESAVLQREIARDAVVAWYRNPSGHIPAALSVAYQDASGTWRPFQPDFLFVERSYEGYRVAIVDPHWTADADGLARLAALADYAEANAGLLSRVNPVTKLPGTDVLRRLSLQLPEVRDAARSAVSLPALFTEHGEDYPLEG